ncbi:PPC domain-containing protein [Anaeromyxobacter soli]|uniref:PPC domain-containing protein n=1 Tax=Anaeromyxobacter soli TaxID=2922725 RepID=UPI001FAF3F50|nr:PPC domain-containing protein [Anaeromyxobacter sp. SG29]
MHAHAIRIVFAVVAAATVAHGSSHTAAQELTSLSTCVQLQDGVPITHLWAAQGQQRCFGLTVPAGQRSLTVDVTQLTGNADLYVRFGAMPTLREYDCRSSARTGGDRCTIADPAPGTWFVMLYARTAFSGATLVAAHEGATCTPLQEGVASTGLSAAQGEQPCFAIGVPAGQSSLVVSTAGGTGNANLYVRQGWVPTTRTYECRSAARTNDESCTIPSPSAGAWYVVLDADKAYSGVALTATYAAQPSGSLLVNSLEDVASPTGRAVTLRSALAAAASGERITFDRSLDGRTILLSIVGDEHTVLKGEVYAAGAFSGYQDRDYGRSALYARKDVVIDASMLPNGITLRWNGGDTSHARVLAVYGNLTMNNVTISSGSSVAEPISGSTQPFTLARGGGLAVWGTATLERCTIAGNTVVGDTQASRDRGSYGGGIYANGLVLRGVVVSGNAAIGYGAAGGGVYSVGGADSTSGRGNNTFLDRCTVSGNLVRAQHAYGGGLFTLSGGPNNLATMEIKNSTVARNLVEDNDALPQDGQYYYRGGGVYMGGGSLSVVASTIAENAVDGPAAIFSGRPNVGGGGVAATIGNAHTVEYVWLQNSIVVGNTLNGVAEDWFPGSILDFRSAGYNVVGRIDFSQILVPVPAWGHLNRRRWPKLGDQEGVALGAALDVAGARFHESIVSAGTDAGGPALLWYPPGTAAADKIPAAPYPLTYVNGRYTGYGVPTDDFLNHVILQLRQEYGSELGSDFGSGFGDLTGTTWYEHPVTWPSDPRNAPWIKFWRDLDVAIGDRLGMVRLGDDFWGTFVTGPLGNVSLTVERVTQTYLREPTDQTGATRSGGLADVGAIEQ